MKKLCLLIVMLSLASMMTAQEETHRYEIKSGMAHSVTRMNDHVTPAVQYFDDYGDCEAMVQTIDMGRLAASTTPPSQKRRRLGL